MKFTFRGNFGVFLSALLAGRLAGLITLISFHGESKGCPLSPGLVRQGFGGICGVQVPRVSALPCGQGELCAGLTSPAWGQLKGPHCTSPVQGQMQFPVPGIFQPGRRCDVTRALESLANVIKK